MVGETHGFIDKAGQERSHTHSGDMTKQTYLFGTVMVHVTLLLFSILSLPMIKMYNIVAYWYKHILTNTLHSCYMTGLWRTLGAVIT